MKIDSIHYHNWKKEPVTIKLLEALQDLRDSVERNMLDADLILDEDSRAKLARLVGIREGLDVVLQIEVDDLVEEINHEEDPSDSA